MKGEDALVELLTALGDDELILGHRHSEWTGYAPHIEEDVAFSSIAQDEIGHAAAFYALVASITGDHTDRLALGRDPGEYRHARLCERPNREWAFTLARHWIYDTAEDVRLEVLELSAHAPLAQVATKIRREERYHLLHADMWMKRVVRGPVEGRVKLIEAVSAVWRDARGLFEATGGEDEAVKEGWLPVPSVELGYRFSTRAIRELDELGLPTDEAEAHLHGTEFVASSSGDLLATEEGNEAASEDDGSWSGGRTGRHSEDFDALWSVMTATYRANPGATW